METVEPMLLLSASPFDEAGDDVFEAEDEALEPADFEGGSFSSGGDDVLLDNLLDDLTPVPAETTAAEEAAESRNEELEPLSTTTELDEQDDSSEAGSASDEESNDVDTIEADASAAEQEILQQLVKEGTNPSDGDLESLAAEEIETQESTGEATPATQEQEAGSDSDAEKTSPVPPTPEVDGGGDRVDTTSFSQTASSESITERPPSAVETDEAPTQVPAQSNIAGAMPMNGILPTTVIVPPLVSSPLPGHSGSTSENEVGQCSTDGGKDKKKKSDGGKDKKKSDGGKDKKKSDGGKDKKKSDGGKDKKKSDGGKDKKKSDGGKDKKKSDGGKDKKKSDGGKDEKKSDGGNDKQDFEVIEEFA